MKYFTSKELGCTSDNYTCMDPIFLDWLGAVRAYANVPFIINSGYRTVEHNTEVGGVEDSAHIKGMAVDIKCTDSATRYKILKACFFAGIPDHILKQIKEHEESTGRVSIPRIGIGDTFIHIDIDDSKPQDVIWLYN